MRRELLQCHVEHLAQLEVFRRGKFMAMAVRAFAGLGILCPVRLADPPGRARMAGPTGLRLPADPVSAGVLILLLLLLPCTWSPLLLPGNAQGRVDVLKQAPAPHHEGDRHHRRGPVRILRRRPEETSGRLARGPDGKPASRNGGHAEKTRRMRFRELSWPAQLPAPAPTALA